MIEKILKTHLGPGHIKNSPPFEDSSMEALKGSVNSFYPKRETGFRPSHFLTPDWDAAGMLSKSALETIRFLNELCFDAKKQFSNFHLANRSIKIVVFEEFLSFYKSQKNSSLPEELQDFSLFWKNLSRLNDQPSKILEDFISIYCFRVATIYLLKLRFISLLSIDMKRKLNQSTLLNPNSFLSQIFKRNSSSELICDSLQSNHYSWFRPSAISNVDVGKLSNNLVRLSLPEMIKICTIRKKNYVNTHKDLNFDNTGYCHALSQKAFGQFLYKIIQLDGELKTKERNDSYNIETSFKTTKFTGHYLNSLAISHWISHEKDLETSQNFHSSNFILPVFSEENFHCGQYFKIFHELLHLSFLIKIAHEKNISATKLICNAMRVIYDRPKNKNEQMSLMLNNDLYENLNFDNIILNLTDFPSKNPHHFLINQIQQQEKFLDKKGKIIVLSNQNLFVPSQSEKVEQLLKGFKVEVIFSFENLKGKGKVPAFCYVLTKKTRNLIGNLSQGFHSKEGCLKFNWNGNLTQFNKFELLTNELKKFLKEREQKEDIPIYRKTLASDLTFEFHQDAIIEGKLLSGHSSQKKDSIMHPQFFNKITETCVPFDQFFYIEKLEETKSSQDETYNLFDLGLSRKENFTSILIVNLSNPHQIQIELTSYESYKAKVNQYGHAFFQYYGLISKRSDIDLNLFKEFFSSQLGGQIIQFSLNGSFTKLKSKLRSLLIPKFFLSSDEIPDHYLSQMNKMPTNVDDVLKSHPIEFGRQCEGLIQLLERTSTNFPRHSLSILSYFSYLLTSSLYIKEKSKKQSHFYNPLFIKSLQELKTYPILPHNQDIYTEVCFQDRKFFNSYIGETVLEHQEDNFLLSLFSDDGTLLIRFHGDKHILELIQFILKGVDKHSLIEILQYLEIPKSKELGVVYENFKNAGQILEKLSKELSLKINKVFINEIFPNKKL